MHASHELLTKVIHRLTPDRTIVIDILHKDCHINNSAGEGYNTKKEQL